MKGLEGALPFIKEGKIGRNMPCWCGSGRKYKQCHEAFDKKIERFALMGHEVPTRDMFKNEDDVQKCRESAKINMACLDAVGEVIRSGMKLSEIDEIVYRTTTEMGGIPAPLNYEGYPYSVCTSVNSQVCHGFPLEDNVLKDGDIVNVDCSTILDGYFSDSSRMFMIGDVAPEVRRLVEVTHECVDLGVEAIRPWTFLGDMAEVIHTHAEKNGYSVVREIGGHGVGFEFHEEPWVSYVSNAGEDMLIVPGMMFTIEPMVNMGKADVYTDEDNGWEVYTKDGLPSAQWEYQIYVREDGVEVISH